MTEITYRDEKAFEARRAGLLPPDPEADKIVLAAREARKAAEEASLSPAVRAALAAQELDAEVRRISARLGGLVAKARAR